VLVLVVVVVDAFVGLRSSCRPTPGLSVLMLETRSTLDPRKQARGREGGGGGREYDRQSEEEAPVASRGTRKREIKLEIERVDCSDTYTHTHTHTHTHTSHLADVRRVA